MYWSPLSYTRTMSERVTPQSDKTYKQETLITNQFARKAVLSDTDRCCYNDPWYVRLTPQSDKIKRQGYFGKEPVCMKSNFIRQRCFKSDP